MRGNTIHISLVKGRQNRTSALFQYDYGQTLLLDGVDLPTYYEVHFSNTEHGESKTSIGDNNGVVVPDEFLKTGKNVYWWLFVHSGEDDGETEYYGVIPVIKRSEPTDEPPTPEQQSAITQTLAAVDAALEEAEGIVTGIAGQIDAALQEAKDSGEFDGPKGDPGDKGDPGIPGAKGDKGDPGDPAPASAVAEAVDAWLVDHPEATTTVEDGSITRGKLNSSLANEIDGKAPAILDTAENRYSFANVISPVTLDYRYSAMAFGNARYADHLNYMPIASLDTSKNEVHFTVADRTIVVDGVASSSSSIYAIDADLPVQAPPGNYTFHFEVDKGSSTISFGQNITIRAMYTDDTQSDLLTKLVQDTNVTADVTTAKTIKKIRVEFYFTARNTYSNHRVWIGMYPSDTVFTDVGEPVLDGSDVSVTINGIVTPSVVDTVQHRSNCTFSVDTKTYVDNNIPDNVVTETDLGFLTPEMFGAVGDGTNDDTQALLDCIAASRANTEVAIPIRGCNSYKISSSIEFSGKNNNVFLHNIVYIGADAAVILHGNTSRYEFDDIQAMSQETSVGIRITTTQDEGFNMNSLSCIRLVTKGNGVEFINSNPSKTIYYNTLSFKSQASAYGNLFVINGNDINEIDLYGKVVIAGNGYIIYDYNTEAQSIIRLHNYCIESGIKYGINTRVSMVECRTEEFFVNPGAPHEDPKAGVLFDFTGKVPHGGSLTDEKTKISYASVDVNDAMSYEDAIDYVESVFKDSTSAQRHTLFVRYIAPTFPKFEYMSQYSFNERINCSMFVYYNHKAVKPKEEWYYKVSSDFDAGIVNNDYIVPTFFDIDASSVVINLDYSYCYLALNKFKVRQYENKKAIVYDKLGNLLFDGTNEPAGVYEFECEFVKHDAITLDIGDGETYTFSAVYSDRVYDGTNEVWHVYKKELVSI